MGHEFPGRKSASYLPFKGVVLSLLLKNSANMRCSSADINMVHPEMHFKLQHVTVVPKRVLRSPPQLSARERAATKWNLTGDLLLLTFPTTEKTDTFFSGDGSRLFGYLQKYKRRKQSHVRLSEETRMYVHSLLRNLCPSWPLRNWPQMQRAHSHPF